MPEVLDDRAEVWLAATLAADTTLAGLVGPNVFNSVADDQLRDGGSLIGAYVTFAYVTTIEESIPLTGPSARSLVTTRYDVVGVMRGRSSTALRPVLDRLNALHGAHSVLNGLAFTAQKVGSIRFLEETDGGFWWHRGVTVDITITRA